MYHFDCSLGLTLDVSALTHLTIGAKSKQSTHLVISSKLFLAIEMVTNHILFIQSNLKFTLSLILFFHLCRKLPRTQALHRICARIYSAWWRIAGRRHIESVSLVWTTVEQLLWIVPPLIFVPIVFQLLALISLRLHILKWRLLIRWYPDLSIFLPPFGTFNFFKDVLIKILSDSPLSSSSVPCCSHFRIRFDFVVLSNTASEACSNSIANTTMAFAGLSHCSLKINY